MASVIAHRIIDGSGIECHGSSYASHRRTRRSNASPAAPRQPQLPTAGGGHRDRCRPVPIPLRAPCSDTGSVSTHPLRPLAPSNAIKTVRRQDDDRRSAAERDSAAPGWRDGSAAGAGGNSAQLEAPTSALSASGDAPAGQHRSVSLDGFLELVHLEHLSPLDLRVLLRVTHREATPRELADSMGHPPTVLRRASARLVARGLLRRRRRRSRHHRLEVTLVTTASGIGAVRRVAQALGIDPSASPTPPVAPDWPATRSNAIGDTTGRPAAAAPPRIDTGARTG